MSSTVWKGLLTFGLVTVPVKLQAAARSERISFNQLHTCGSRIQQKIHCPKCKTVVPQADLEKGFEFEPGRFLTFDEAELDEIEPASSKELKVFEFVRLADVDPILYNASYYVLPDTAVTGAYHLLCQAMAKSKHVGVARLTMHRREHFVVLRPADGRMVLHTLFYADEVRMAEEVAESGLYSDEELQLAMQFITVMTRDFNPAAYRDAYREALQVLIEAKGKAMPAGRGAVADLAKALEQSIAGVPSEGQPTKEPKRRGRKPRAAATNQDSPPQG